MKLICGLCLLVAATLVASPLFAADVSSQPLTRADCYKGGMTWNENANVCGSDSEAFSAASEAVLETFAAETSGQPLTTHATSPA